MALAVAYTESDLAAFIILELGAAASELDWTAASAPILYAINRTARSLGSEIADVTDMAALEAVAAWQAWEVCVRGLFGAVNESIGSQSLQLDALYQHAKEMRLGAKVAAQPHDRSYAVTSTRIDYSFNPYAARELDDDGEYVTAGWAH